MKKILYTLILLTTTTLYSIAQDISTLRIGQFKIEQTQEQVESILGNPLPKSQIIKSDTDYNYYVPVTNNGQSFLLRFGKDYNKEEEAYVLRTVIYKGLDYKTKSGIKVGLTKLDVIKILDDSGMDYSYDRYTEKDDNGKKIKTHESFRINDNTAGKSLIIEMKNNKVYQFELSYSEEGC